LTLQRTWEPCAADTLDEARDYEAFDHSEDVRLFVDDLLALEGVRGDVLDLGTRTALIAIEVCRRLDDCRVMAVDASTYMLDLARLNIEIAGLIDRITLDYVDASQLPHPDQYFDIVLSNGIVHRVADPSIVFRGVLRVIRPGGLLFFRDWMRPDSEDAAQRLVESYAGDASEQQRDLVVRSLRSALSLHEIREIVQQLGFDSQTVQATSDRHWTWTARRP
jgi:ubiquinone/menaquinone biosynthesis C-methylase UbiE